MTARPVPVWDLPTRIFHWALVIAVVVSYVTGGEEGSWFVVHTVSGYIVARLLDRWLIEQAKPALAARRPVRIETRRPARPRAR